MKVELPELKYPDKQKRAPFYKEMLRRVQALPGVRSAAFASTYRSPTMATPSSSQSKHGPILPPTNDPMLLPGS